MCRTSTPISFPGFISHRTWPTTEIASLVIQRPRIVRTLGLGEEDIGAIPVVGVATYWVVGILADAVPRTTGFVGSPCATAGTGSKAAAFLAGSEAV